MIKKLKQTKSDFTRHLYPALLGLSVMTFSACSGGGGSTPTPGVDSASPTGTGVARSTNLSAAFTEEIDDLTAVIASEFTLADNFNSVSGNVSYDIASRTATFDPITDLGLLRLYTANLGTGITYSGGTPIAQYTWTFRTADGTWTSDQDLVLIYPDTTINDPHVARSMTGDAMAIWTNNVNVYASIFTASGGTWGNDAIVSATGTAKSHLRLAMDNSGNAMAVWSDNAAGPNDYLSARYYNGASWGTTTLNIAAASGTPNNSQVAFDANGNAIVVWLQNNRVYANRYTGTWAGAQIIDAGATIAYKPQLAVFDNGDAIAVWAQNDGMTDVIYANYYTNGGTWGGATPLDTTPAANASVPQVALDKAGNAMAVWLEGNAPPYAVYAEYYDSGTGWTLTPTPLETDVNGVSITNIPQLGMDGDGNAIAIWRAAPTGGNDRLRYARYNGTSWGTPGNVDNGFSDSTEASLAMDSEGHAIVVWLEHADAMASVDSTWANRYRNTGSGGWAGPVLLENDDTAPTSAPKVSMDYNGTAAAVWLQDKGNTYNTTWSARFE